VTTTSVAGGANHNVTVYGNGTVVLGDGNDIVNVKGSGEIRVGNGNDTLNIMQTGTVVAGSGNDRILLQGGGSISVGGGNDSLTLNGSGNIAQTGASAHDTINIGSGNYSLSVAGNATVQSSGYVPPVTAPHTVPGFGFGLGNTEDLWKSSTLLNSRPDVGRTDGRTYVAEQSASGASTTAPASNGGATIAGGQLTVTHLGGVTQEIATAGTMTLLGGASATEFIGGTGNTMMIGRSGADTFIGGSGHDTMVGVGQNNVFEFLASESGGQHVIANFVSSDQLNVEGHNLEYLMAHNEVTTHDGNTFISIDGGKTTIELQGVSEPQSSPLRPHFRDPTGHR
jgi:Ca2+-binding RTX toxin-like protein